MSTVTSRDGTAIAYQRCGTGPAVILVDGALCSRTFGPMPKLSAKLAAQFSVITYDRRGRGESGDTQPYSKAHEVEDIDALLQMAGGSAHLVGLSSGAALALEAAASGLAVTRVAGYEPPYINDGQQPTADHEANLRALLADNRRGAAVKYFMRDMVGVPSFVVVMMRLMPWLWRKLEAVAHTLPYDAAVMGSFAVPTERLAAIATPTLVMHGGKTDERLKKAALAVAETVPRAQHRTLAGQRHDVSLEVLAPALIEFLRN